jgi:hypothetical protein
MPFNSQFVGNSEIIMWFGKSRLKVEVLPVWRAPVSTTTGRVRADRRKRGSISRGIHICDKLVELRHQQSPSELWESGKRVLQRFPSLPIFGERLFHSSLFLALHTPSA